MKDAELRSLLKENFDRIDRRFDGMDGRFDGIDGRLDGIDGRLDGIDDRLDGIDGRLDGIDGRLDGIDGRLDGMDGRLDGMDGRFEQVDARFEQVDAHFLRTDARIEERFNELHGQLEIMAEHFDGSFQFMSEGLRNIDEKAERRAADLDAAMKQGFADTYSTIFYLRDLMKPEPPVTKRSR